MLDICRYMPQAKRRDAWCRVHGSLPEGTRLGSNCHVPYCGFLDHMTLVEDKTIGWNNWSPYTAPLESLRVGDSVEFNMVPEDRMKLLRTALAQQWGTLIAIRTSKDGSRFRLYRVAASFQDRVRGQALAATIPVVWNPRAVSPEEKLRRQLEAARLREERRIARERRFFERRRRLGHQSVWLGQFRLTRQDEEFLALPRRRACTEKACPHPQVELGKCRYHLHYFDFKWSMEWRQLPRDDFMATPFNPTPLLSVQMGWELPRSAERTVFEHKGVWDKGRKLSDDWWHEQVEKYVAELPKPTSHVRVISDRGSEQKYAEEEAITNIQHTGAFVLWKGFGRKKIRKKQRMRPQGWHGNHPEQKPRERFSRDTLDDIPTWAPPHKREEVYEDIYLDDDSYTTLAGSYHEQWPCVGQLDRVETISGDGL